MQRRLFTEEEHLELKKNLNILKAVNSNVEFDEGFKQKALFEQTELGKSAKQIFAETGIPDWLNVRDYAKDDMKRQHKLQRKAKKPHGRPATDMNKPISEMNMEGLHKRVTYLDNAQIKSFFGHLKDEIDLKSCQSFEEVKSKAENYIYYYNNERYQWNLNKMITAQRRCHLLNSL